jgi:hypothetical protein
VKMADLDELRELLANRRNELNRLNGRLDHSLLVYGEANLRSSWAGLAQADNFTESTWQFGRHQTA